MGEEQGERYADEGGGGDVGGEGGERVLAVGWAWGGDGVIHGQGDGAVGWGGGGRGGGGAVYSCLRPSPCFISGDWGRGPAVDRCGGAHMAI